MKRHQGNTTELAIGGQARVERTQAVETGLTAKMYTTYSPGVVMESHFAGCEIAWCRNFDRERQAKKQVAPPPAPVCHVVR
jgi:hypothetical protein